LRGVLSQSPFSYRLESRECPRQMQRTNVVGFKLRSKLFSSICLIVLAQDLCYSDPLSLVLTFLTHTMAVRILSLVPALPSLCVLCMPLMFRSQQPQKNSHRSTSETHTQSHHAHTHTISPRTHARTHTHTRTHTSTHARTNTHTHTLAGAARFVRWAEAHIKIARMTLTIKLDRNWSSFQLANSAPPLSVTDSAIAPSARMQ
jgi:hypothetical protein